jgi:restriction endonuclease
MVKFLSFYTEKFKDLNRSVTPDGIAPHKPVLLLAIIAAVADKSIEKNVFPKPILKTYFDHIWKNLVTTNHKCNLDSPFSALLSEGFWHIYQNKSKDYYRSAYLDDELFEYLQLENARNVLVRTLLDSYFWNVKTQWGMLYPELFATPTTNNYASATICKKDHKGAERTTSMLELAKSLNISSLLIPNRCLESLSAAHVYSIADFCIFDLNQLKGIAGIGEKKILELYELQNIQRNVYKILIPIPSLELENFCGNRADASPISDLDKIGVLHISQSCLTALNNLNVKTIRDFCVFDLNALIGTPGIGKRKVRNLYDLQKSQRDIYRISIPLPELNFEKQQNGTAPESVSCEKNCYCYPQTYVSFMSIPMRENMVSLDENKDVASLDLPETLKRLFRGMGIFEFDDLYLIGSTCIEYFLRYLGDCNFQTLLCHLKREKLWKDTKHQIASQGIIEEKWKRLFIPKSLFSSEEYALLKRMDIVTWSDYDAYITASHNVDTDFVSICNFHNQNASKIKHFQKLLDELSGNSFENTFFSTWDSKSRRIYELRTFENKTLEEVSAIVDLTRERVRQITKKMDEQVVVERPLQFPLNPLSALFAYIEAIFEYAKGIVQQRTLFQTLAADFNLEEQYQYLMLLFCKLNFGAISDKGNIILPQHMCLSCKIVYDKFFHILSTKEALTFEEQVQLVQQECNECVQGKSCDVCWNVFLPKFYEYNFAEKAVFDPEDNILFSGKEYLMRRGTRRKVVEYVLSPDKKLSFAEIYRELLKYRSDLNERQVYGYIQAADTVLADRGVYMLASVLPTLPVDLLNMIIDAINQKLQLNPNTFLSLTVVMKKFHERLKAVGCMTPYMLFEILKRSGTIGIRYIKCPYVTSEKNTYKFSISDLLEDYIAENGRTSLENLRQFICSSVGVNEHVFTIAYSNSEKLLVDDDDCLLSIDDLEINREDLTPVISKLGQLNGAASITVKQLFDEHRVLCVRLNINGPKLLFNVLRVFESGNFIFRYPQISKNRESIIPIRQQVIEFIKETNSYCTVDELNNFSKKNHLSSRYWYFPRADYPELLKYLSGAWVHIETLGYAKEWSEIVTEIARKVLSESTAPLKSYANLQEVCDREDELPILKNDLWWTPTLIAEILEESGDFLVYGKNKQFFSLKNTDLKLNNFGDLCALLLEESFDGAANLHEFSNYLRSKDLISNCDLHNSLLQGSKRIIIDNHEVYVSEDVL